MINFGIDLGTTNSSIAKFDKGQVVVFKNPIGQKDTLPSVVAFRKGRIIVGEKAREFLLKAPDQVAGSFKRKMGTSETLSLSGEPKTPVELSAQVLKELKTFVHTGESPQAAVITIPASFDTIQSNATKEAGYLAGFEQVVLLQEPIAASLAYANQDETEEFAEGQWLVYDLGGGTFDVALVRIQDGEMTVLDHEGDNFLGGTDFDQAIVEQLVVPYLELEGQFDNLLQEMRSATGKYNQLYYTLLHKAEEAKVQLSSLGSAEIEFEIEDDGSNLIDAFLTIERSQFEALIEPYLEQTVQRIREMLERNQLKAEALRFVLMVGGSTYIPYVREQVAERLGIAVNTRVDPTTAVAVGAAFYAGTKRIQLASEKEAAGEKIESPLEIRVAFQKATQEEEEYFTATFEGPWEGLYYRITRTDGGYDSGLKLISPQIREYLALAPNTYNEFELTVFDEQNNRVPTQVDPIGITQGRYSVVGQPLPNDICLEIDDIENDTTVLEVIFEKNAVLPLKRTLVKQMTRTIAKGSNERLTLTIVEGPGTALPAANQPIGFISISGKQLTRDLVRGSDVEITLEMSESRDLSINAYLMMTDQEFEDVFTPSVRRVNVPRLVDELMGLAEKIRSEIGEAEDQGNYESAQELVDLEFEILEVADRAKKLKADDVTDDKFQIEDLKRRVAQKVDELTRDKFIIRVKNEYFEVKRDMEHVMENYQPSEKDETDFEELIGKEKHTLATNSSLRIKEYIDQMLRLNWRIRWNSSKYIRNFFHSLCFGLYGMFSDMQKAEQLITQGREAIKEENDDRLRVIINQLCDLLPPSKKKQVGFGGTGIG
ncbi:MAG: Hsp70 family protein [Bacteroidota bacterium]